MHHRNLVVSIDSYSPGSTLENSEDCPQLFHLFLFEGLLEAKLGVRYFLTIYIVVQQKDLPVSVTIYYEDFDLDVQFQYLRQILLMCYQGHQTHLQQKAEIYYPVH